MRTELVNFSCRRRSEEGAYPLHDLGIGDGFWTAGSSKAELWFLRGQRIVIEVDDTGTVRVFREP